MSSLTKRFADRSTWPHKWWWPLPDKLHLPDDELYKQHAEVSKTINRLLLTVIVFSFFCELALGRPDRSLIASDGSSVKLPFADTEISFVSFLVLGPLVLVALSLYQQVFIGYWIPLSRQLRSLPSGSERASTGLPFVFNLRSWFATSLSYFLFYWLVPLVLFSLTWEASTRPEATWLIFLACAFTLISLLLQMRRRSDRAHKVKAAVLVLAFIGILCATYEFAGRKRPLNLVKTDLSHQDFDYFNLVAARMQQANLAGTSLRGANLTGAQMQQAILTNTDLSEAIMEGANLAGAHLKATQLQGANLKEADLRNTDLAGADLAGVDLAKANLESAKLANKDLSLHDLKNADLSNTDLSCANLWKANLSGANLMGANLKGTELEFADLSGVNLSWTKLSALSLANANLSRANLSGADLSGANLSGANLKGANLKAANLKGARLSWSLSDTIGLTQEQIDSAIGEKGTWLPTGIHTPDSWH